MLESPVLIMATNGHKRSANDAASTANAAAAVAAAVRAVAASNASLASDTLSLDSDSAIASSTDDSSDMTVDDCQSTEIVIVNSPDDHRRDKSLIMEADKENQTSNGTENGTAETEVKPTTPIVDYYNVKYCPPKEKTNKSSEMNPSAKEFIPGKKPFINNKKKHHNGTNFKPKSTNGHYGSESNSAGTSTENLSQNNNNSNNNKKNFENGNKKFYKSFYKSSADSSKNWRENGHNKALENGKNDDNNNENNLTNDHFKKKSNPKYHKDYRLPKALKNVQNNETTTTTAPTKKRIYYSDLSNDQVIAIMKEVSATPPQITDTPSASSTTASASSSTPISNDQASEKSNTNNTNKSSSPKTPPNEPLTEQQLTKEDLDVVSGGIAISVPLLPDPAIVDSTTVTCCLVSHPGHFYIRFDDGSFKSLNESMNTFYGEDEDNHIELSFDCIKSGQYYAACRAERDWIRIQILQAQSNDILHCNLIDNAGVEVFKVTQLQPLYNQFRTVPKQAIKCELFRVKPKVGDDWSVDDLIRFKEMFMNKQFTIDKQTVIDQCQYEEKQRLLIHDLYNHDKSSIVEQLVKDGLAELQ